jgi:hypothetical protein
MRHLRSGGCFASFWCREQQQDGTLNRLDGPRSSVDPGLAEELVEGLLDQELAAFADAVFVVEA